MEIIKNKKEFLEWIVKDVDDEKFKDKAYYGIHDQILIISDEEFVNLDLRNKHFLSTKFINCHFDNCDFHHTIISNCIFENCRFQDCEIGWSKFIETDLIKCQFESCGIHQLELADIIAKKVLFINCREILDLKLGGGVEHDYSFINSFVAYLNVGYNNKLKLYFLDSIVEKSSFSNVDLSDSEFESCNLSSNSFTNCILGKNLFLSQNNVPAKEFNFVDIRSILESPTQEGFVLENIFGIPGADIKEYLYGLVYKIEFQSIFISYSFKDRKFAKQINDELLAKGIMTFLWEKDAPGGKKLTSIMSSNVKSKDRVLFIASKNSLKSKACQFELSEGRKKQEQIWEDVLFPIHIDNYLFEVKKDDIRPLESQDEYWSNIQELKGLHSVDFTQCIEPNEGKDLFEKQFFKLIKGLRKNA